MKGKKKRQRQRGNKKMVDEIGRKKERNPKAKRKKDKAKEGIVEKGRLKD